LLFCFFVVFYFFIFFFFNDTATTEIYTLSLHDALPILSGVFYCCREAIPLMRERGGGYIFNISSLAGVNAFASGSAYNASKFGLNGFSEAMMQDVRYEKIRVSYIMPGSVATEFGAPAGASPAAASKERLTWKLTGEDIAKAVVDLYKFPSTALASRIEMRPSRPPKK